jgi:hypothetical protein
MKSFTIIHVLLLLLLLLAYQCTHAQDYIITSKGDSIAGTVKQWSFGSSVKVQVTKQDKSKEVFTVLQVRSFSDNGNVFHPVKFSNKYQFMKLVKPGYVSLYAFQPEGQLEYSGQYLLQMDGKGMEVPNLNFRKALTKFFADCEEVSNKISTGSYNRKDLDTLLDDYNQCVAKRSHIISASNRTIDGTRTKPWDNLLEKIEAHEEFEGKADAIEMVREIKAKIQRNEKVPNFLTSGLKALVIPASLSEPLNAALNDLNSTE